MLVYTWILVQQQQPVWFIVQSIHQNEFSNNNVLCIETRGINCIQAQLFFSRQQWSQFSILKSSYNGAMEERRWEKNGKVITFYKYKHTSSCPQSGICRSCCSVMDVRWFTQLSISVRMSVSSSVFLAPIIHIFMGYMKFWNTQLPLPNLHKLKLILI